MSSLRTVDPAVLLVPRALLQRVPAFDPARLVVVPTEDALAEPPLWIDRPIEEEDRQNHKYAGRCFNGKWFAQLYSRLRLADTAPIRYVPFNEPDPLDPALAARLYAAGVPMTTSLEVGKILATRAAGWDLARVAPARSSHQAIGSARPRLVVVGEWNPRAHGYHFFSRSGVWLFRGLRELGHDELQVLATNARGGRKKEANGELAAMATVLAPHQPTWIALGEVAGKELRRLGIPHVAAQHPAWHKRFKYAEDVRGYAARLRKAGVPFGPYEAPFFDDVERTPLPSVAVDEVPELPDIVAAPAQTHAYQPLPRVESERVACRGRGAVTSDKLEKARRAFVQGEVPSVRAAAKLVGCSGDRLAVIATSQEWEVERERYKEQVREAEYRQKAEAEAQARVQLRQRAALGANLGLKQVTDVYLEAERAANRVAEALAQGQAPEQRDVDAAKRRAKPKEVEALARILALCDDSPQGSSDPDRDRLQKLSIADLKREFDRVFARNFGELPREAIDAVAEA